MLFQKKKPAYVALVALMLFALFGMSSCGRRHHRSFDDRRPTGTYRYEQNSGRHSGGGGCSRGNNNSRPMSPNIHQPIYFMQKIEVHQGISFQEALYQVDPSTQEEEQKYGVGGTKLVAEMSADARGIYCSRDPNAEVNINILSLDQLKLHIDHSNTSVYQQIINQQIVINNSKVGFLNGNSLAEIFEDFINALLTGRMVVHLTIANVTNRLVTCEIKQGQMLEIVNENVQNLVVAETRRFSIAAHQETNIDIRVYCASQHRGDPSGSRVRFTPYLLNASSNVYETQSSVWDYIEYGY